MPVLQDGQDHLLARNLRCTPLSLPALHYISFSNRALKTSHDLVLFTIGYLELMDFKCTHRAVKMVQKKSFVFVSTFKQPIIMCRTFCGLQVCVLKFIFSFKNDRSIHLIFFEKSFKKCMFLYPNKYTLRHFPHTWYFAGLKCMVLT